VVQVTMRMDFTYHNLEDTATVMQAKGRKFKKPDVDSSIGILRGTLVGEETRAITRKRHRGPVVTLVDDSDDDDNDDDDNKDDDDL
jgi:hypothetical protein